MTARQTDTSKAFHILLNEPQLKQIDIDLNIEGIKSFNQFSFQIKDNPPQYRNITLLGEFHGDTGLGLSNICPNDISVAEYLVGMMKVNQLAYTLLEYGSHFVHTDRNVTEIGSPNIREAVTLLEKNSLTGRIHGVDYRRVIIDEDINLALDHLYLNDLLNKELLWICDNLTTPLQIFLAPTAFKKNPQTVFGLLMTDPDNYTHINFTILNEFKQLIEEQIKYIMSHYLPEIEEAIKQNQTITLGQFTEALEHSDPYWIDIYGIIKKIPQRLLDDLKIAYAWLVDFYILKNVLRQNLSIDHFIILVGQHHVDNILKRLEHLPKTVSLSKNKSPMDLCGLSIKKSTISRG